MALRNLRKVLSTTKLPPKIQFSSQFRVIYININVLSPVVGKLIAKSTEVTATGTFQKSTEITTSGTFQKKYQSYRYRYFFKKVTCNFEVTSYKLLGDKKKQKKTLF